MDGISGVEVSGWRALIDFVAMRTHASISWFNSLIASRWTGDIRFEVFVHIFLVCITINAHRTAVGILNNFSNYQHQHALVFDFDRFWRHSYKFKVLFISLFKELSPEHTHVRRKPAGWL